MQHEEATRNRGRVHAAGIPKEQIQTIFYTRDKFDAPLDTGKTYFMKLDIHTNYYSFLFKELNSDEDGPGLATLGASLWAFRKPDLE